MTYRQLKKIIKFNTKPSNNKLPVNSFVLASKLHLIIKNQQECKEDFKNADYPLSNTNAIYAIHKGEYTIYYNQDYEYYNFAIAHEIAHHLLQHSHDGITQHQDANLMAAMLVAPKHLISKNKIKSYEELSEKCLIPIQIAMEYWSYLHSQNIKYTKKIIAVSSIFLLITISAIMPTFYAQTNNTTDSNNLIITTSEPVPITSPIVDNDVYITPSGDKYHKKTCQYVKNNDSAAKTPLNDAISLGYLPCKVCFEQ